MTVDTRSEKGRPFSPSLPIHIPATHIPPPTNAKRTLALHFVRVADNGGFCDIAVLEQGALNFGRAHAVARDVNHVVDAVEQEGSSASRGRHGAPGAKKKSSTHRPVIQMWPSASRCAPSPVKNCRGNRDARETAAPLLRQTSRRKATRGYATSVHIPERASSTCPCSAGGRRRCCGPCPAWAAQSPERRSCRCLQSSCPRRVTKKKKRAPRAVPVRPARQREGGGVAGRTRPAALPQACNAERGTYFSVKQNGLNAGKGAHGRAGLGVLVPGPRRKHNAARLCGYRTWGSVWAQGQCAQAARLHHRWRAHLSATTCRQSDSGPRQPGKVKEWAALSNGSAHVRDAEERALLMPAIPCQSTIARPLG